MSFNSPKNIFSSCKGSTSLSKSGLCTSPPLKSAVRNLAYQLFRSPAWKSLRPSGSTIHETPLSLLPVAVTLIFSSCHRPPFASHTEASSFRARRCFSISFDKMSTISGFTVFQPSIERSKWSSWKWEENTYSGFSDRKMGGRTFAGSFQKSNRRMHLSVSTAKQL